MNKNRIRLTESQLHNVIKESVKQVLSELDWKTYQNAANVAREKGRKWNDANGDNPRAEKFRDAAKEQFAKDKGYDEWDETAIEHIPEDPEEDQYYWHKFTIPYQGEYPTPTYKEGYEESDWSETFDGRQFTSHYNDYFGPDDYGYHEYFNDEDYPPNKTRVRSHSMSSRIFPDPSDDNKIEKKLRNDTTEVNDFKNGNYEYQKGKGWQKKDGLDESIRRAIRKVLH